MGELPDEFDCTITNWEYIHGLCRTASEQAKAVDSEPDVAAALVRSRWFAGRPVCALLGPDATTRPKLEPLSLIPT